MSKEMPEIKVGDGVSYVIHTDRHAGTVIAVSKSGKTLTMQLDKATRTDKNGQSECQEHTYERNPDGLILKFTWREKKKGFQLSAHRGRGCYLIEGRHEYRDPHF